MKFKIKESGCEKELLLYSRNGQPMDEELEHLELTGISNWVHSRITTYKENGPLLVTEDEFEWWQRHYKKIQGRLSRLHRMSEMQQNLDDTAVFNRIIEEELTFHGEDHGDRRDLTARVKDRLREHYRK